MNRIAALAATLALGLPSLAWSQAQDVDEEEDMGMCRITTSTGRVIYARPRQGGTCSRGAGSTAVLDSGQGYEKVTGAEATHAPSASQSTLSDQSNPSGGSFSGESGTGKTLEANEVAEAEDSRRGLPRERLELLDRIQRTLGGGRSGQISRQQEPQANHSARRTGVTSDRSRGRLHCDVPNGKPALYERADFSGMVVPMPQFRTGTIYASDEESFAGRAAAACVPAGFEATLYDRPWQQGEDLKLEGPTEVVLDDIGWGRRVQSVTVRRITGSPRSGLGEGGSQASGERPMGQGRGSPQRPRPLRGEERAGTSGQAARISEANGSDLISGDAANIILRCGRTPTVYERYGFGGWSAPILEGRPIRVDSPFVQNPVENFSSICVPYGYQVQLFDQRGEVGGTIILEGPIEINLADVGWDGQVQSLKLDDILY